MSKTKTAQSSEKLSLTIFAQTLNPNETRESCGQNETPFLKPNDYRN